MAGQINKRGDAWLVRIFLGRDANGKRRYFNKTIHGTKRDAQKYLNAALREKDLGIFVEQASMPLNEYLDKWLTTAAKPRLAQTTFDNYEFLLKRHIRPAIGQRKLCDVKPLDVQKIYTTMTGGGLSARTVRYVHAVLFSAFKQAVKWDLLSRNPCESVELPRLARNEMQAFSPEQAQKFLETAKDDKHGIVFAFALATGMRPEEYLSLKWSDVDLQKGMATVQRTLVWRKGGGWYFGEPKTKQSRRTMPLPASLIRDLTIHKRRQTEHRFKFGAAYQNNELVFAAETGTPLCHRNLFQRHFTKLLEKAELPTSFRLYDLRHSCATLLLSAGENPKVVAERLGHASIVLTLDTYSHILPDMQKGASDKLEAMLYRKNGTL
jgi:integrase